MVLIGKKQLMSQVFDDNKVVPVTVVSVKDNVIAKINKDGTCEVGFGENKRAGKQAVGMYRELGFVPKYTRVFKLGGLSVQVGSKLNVGEIVKVGDFVKVVGISKGKGFAGVMKRWNFKGGPATRGQGNRPRHQGSIGSQTPGKVWKGKHMAGRMGGEQVVLKKLKVVGINDDKILLGGSLPGSSGSLTYIYV